MSHTLTESETPSEDLSRSRSLRLTRSPSLPRSDHVGSMDQSATPKITRTRSSRAFFQPLTYENTPTVSPTNSKEERSLTPKITRTISTRTPSDPAVSWERTEAFKRSKSLSEPMTEENTGERSVANFTETRVIPVPVEELTSTEKVLTILTGVATAVLALVAPSALDSLQTTVLFSQMGCMHSTVRDMARANDWITSPLAAWCPAIVAPHEANMILWNMVLLGVFWGAHYMITRASGSPEQLMFPSLSLTLATFLYQGSTFAAYRSAFQGDEAVYVPLTVVTLGMSLGLPIWIRRWLWLQTTPPPPPQEDHIPPNHIPDTTNTIISLKWLPCRKIVAFVPYGLWGPEELVSTPPNDVAESGVAT